MVCTIYIAITCSNMIIMMGSSAPSVTVLCILRGSRNMRKGSATEYFTWAGDYTMDRNKSVNYKAAKLPKHQQKLENKIEINWAAPKYARFFIIEFILCGWWWQAFPLLFDVCRYHFPLCTLKNLLARRIKIVWVAYEMRQCEKQISIFSVVVGAIAAMYVCVCGMCHYYIFDL